MKIQILEMIANEKAFPFNQEPVNNLLTWTKERNSY